MRSLIPLAVLAAVLCAAAPFASAQSPRPVAVQILAINDFHGNLEPAEGAEGAFNQVPAGGAEYLATHLRRATSENPNTIVVGAGDLIGASPLLSGLFHDRPTIEALNAMNLSVTALGNHELDRGAAEFEKLAKSGTARFDYLAANVFATGTRQLILPPTAIRTVAGVTIGFIGELLQAAPQVISAPAIKGLEFGDEVAAANQAAARLEKEGVRAIVLLLHDGGAQHPSAKGAPIDPNGCAGMTESFANVAKQLAPSIKVVLSGHSHQAYNCEIGGHLVTSASANGRLFTRVSLTLDPATGAIERAAAKNEIVTRDVPKDPAVSAILDKYRPEAARLANRTVGRITAEIGRNANPAGESPLGDIVADALLAATDNRAAIAFMQPGGIRATVQGRVNSSGQRTVSYADLYKVEPFHDQVMILTATGDLIRRILEQQFERGTKILQVSSGFTYEYRANAEPGHHVVPESIRLNGRPISPNDIVNIAAVDFLANGGSGFTAFKEAKVAEAGPFLLDGLVDYFAKNTPVAPGRQDRIKRLDAEVVDTK